MQDYKYKLEKASKKYQCPSCSKKRFVKYINIETNEHLPNEYGRCDREINCGYHLNPYKNGYHKNNASTTVVNLQRLKPIKRQKTVFFPKEILYKTRQNYNKNVFIQNLLYNVPFPFNEKEIEKIIALYHLGTISKGYRKGAITFPFIDLHNNVRTVQVKQFDKNNHTIGTDFLHSIMTKNYIKFNKKLPNWLKEYNQNDTKVSCLFGEHLLNRYPTNPVALVEAPKTAIYGALYFGFPETATNYIWLAVYNLSSLNLKKCTALRGRKVFLFPDLAEGGKAYELWNKKIDAIQLKMQNTSFKMSNLLEKYATLNDRKKGKDLADYLIQLDWRHFKKD
ncbi:DUF6371 domain-containing protein [Mesonia sp. HuA40]|uniref:DUF6371 domain-containing protein n=1 Tax=Mesonia sp. HuA40 TaxID=2602761 RepID=UPI0011CC7D10|nr:DUF6371 domain-containing protein [Mesonia sp. HuA40]TXK74542.1 hypothetical protein FT993_01870 [Mesonia sp. HuA40]